MIVISLKKLEQNIQLNNTIINCRYKYIWRINYTFTKTTIGIVLFIQTFFKWYWNNKHTVRNVTKKMLLFSIYTVFLSNKLDSQHCDILWPSPLYVSPWQCIYKIMSYSQGVIWLASSGVTSRDNSSENRAGSQYCGSPAAWESSHAKPSFSRWSWKTAQKILLYDTKSIQWCFLHTYKDMTGPLSLPLEAVSDLAHCHVALFLWNMANNQIWRHGSVKVSGFVWYWLPLLAEGQQCDPCWALLGLTGLDKSLQRESSRSHFP